jgi:hypothetical protein
MLSRHRRKVKVFFGLSDVFLTALAFEAACQSRVIPRDSLRNARILGHSQDRRSHHKMHLLAKMFIEGGLAAMRSVLSLFAATALLLAVSGVASASDLVVNGGFETGYPPQGNFTGWTQWGAEAALANQVICEPFAKEGSCYAKFGAIGEQTGISQDLPTVSGTAYQISFWLAGGSFGNLGDVESILISFGAVDLLNSADQDFGGVWTPFTFTETATSNSTTLSLGFRDDAAVYYLDGVTVDPEPAVPEPAAFALAGLGLVGLGLLRRKLA